MDLPENIRSFPFDVKGDVTQKKYDGDFKVKCILDMFDKRMLEVEKSNIRADLKNPTAELMAYSTILASLRVRIQEGPPWWEQSNGGYSVKDENVIIDLFDKVSLQEQNWRDELKAAAEKVDTEGNLPKES